MAQHAERFTGRVADYERYRTRYPATVVDILRDRCGLTAESVVADIGAGTGMLAELFLANGMPGSQAIAIEPNAEMRAACERLVAQYPGFAVRAAAAESTGLADASVDFVAAGRAFHWFDQARALAEFRRILRPRGWVVLISSGRSRDASAESEELERILLQHGTDYGETRGKYRLYEGMPALFPGGDVVREQLHSEQRLTREEFFGQMQSLSVTPHPGDPNYAAMQRALDEFFTRFAVASLLRMGVTVSVLCCQVT
jgi:SAM-dependent methyltransferase